MKNFTQKFIGLLALLCTMSYMSNAQNECNVYMEDLAQSALYFDLSNDAEYEIYQDLVATLLGQLMQCQSNINDVIIYGLENTIDELEYTNYNLLQNQYNLLQNQFVSLNIPITLNQGWSMFGYTCLESVDVMVGFSAISDKIEIVKDEWGLAYLPAWGFSAFETLEFGEGYQIKLLEDVGEFSFCSNGIVGVLGCTDLTAFNYNSNAHIDNGSCIEVVNGCTNSYADNYAYNANIDDGSCIISGCMNSNAFNYNLDATYEPENICVPIIFGCTHYSSSNYNTSANTDDGSCLGCTYSWADNYEINSGVNDGSCALEGCMDESAANYNPNVTNDNGMCVSDCSETITLLSQGGNGGGSYGQWAWFTGKLSNILSQGDIVYSSNGSAYTISNYNMESYYNDNTNISQVYFTTNVAGVFTNGNTYQSNISPCIYGCTDQTAQNYQPIATTDNDSCIAGIPGCMNSNSENYNANATYDDGTCIQINGCTDNSADNYNNIATNDDGSCMISGCTDYNADNFNITSNTDDGSCIYYGCTESEAANYDETANVDDESCLYCQNVIVFVGGGYSDEDINYLITNNNDDEVYTGSAGSVDLCLSDGSYNLALQSSSPYELDGASYSIETCNTTILANSSPLYDVNNDVYTFDVFSNCNYISGCTNPSASNYNENANIEDGSCVIFGCTEYYASNYNQNANQDDESCLGCTNSGAYNFNSWAMVDDGSCGIYGCTDETAENYNPDATSNATCIYNCNEVITLLSQGGNGGGSYGQWAWFTGNITNVLSQGDIVYSSNGSAYTISNYDMESYYNDNTNISQVLFTTNVAGAFTNGNTYQTNVYGCE